MTKKIKVSWYLVTPVASKHQNRVAIVCAWTAPHARKLSGLYFRAGTKLSAHKITDKAAMLWFEQEQKQKTKKRNFK